MPLRRSLSLLCAGMLLPAMALAQADGKPAKKSKKGRDPESVDLNDSPQVALKKFSVAEGLVVDLWASEPLLANPVAFSMDDHGRAFVAETYRRRTSAFDIRKNMDWLLPDLAFRSVADRIEFLKSANAPEAHRTPDANHEDLNKDGQFDWHDLNVESERIRLVEDSNGDGVADTASTFAEGFNKIETGVAAGILARGNEVWLACIPDVWRLEGATRTVATKQEPILTGFGVHVAYSGHDMHGMKMGPDGRIYWSIADCGAHVQTKEGTTISVPDCGAVFRANPDGTQMELVAYGLRNPQCLAFNEVGDLFTGDNNADGGDKARWEHVVPGGDYGWRIGWQFLPQLGAWNSERMWELDAGQTALAILPPVGHIGHGPAGIAYYPGTGLPASYRDHFFYVDFPGGVRSFALQPKGASYTVENPNEILLDNTPQKMEGKLLWGLYPSDIQFGVEGGAYVLDWIAGWEKTGKGRIYRVHDPETDRSKSVQETRRQLADDFGQLSEEELLRRLDEPDMRVRLDAQLALAARGEGSIPALVRLAESAVTKNQNDRMSQLPLSRLHALWALAQIGRQQPRAFAEIAALLGDPEPEIRAQAAKLLGESRQPANGPRLLPLLKDPEPRVRFAAALSLGQLHAAQAVAPLISLLRERTGDDAYLRHAAVMGLTQCADVPALTTYVRDPSREVRTGVLLALRRLGRPEVATFLGDWEPQLVLEAARAIHDEPIPDALPLLARWAGQPGQPLPLARRVINAAYLVGTVEQANALARWVTQAGEAEAVRLDLLDALGHWDTALGRDRVVGLARPLPAGRVAEAAAQALSPILPALLKDTSQPIRLAALEAVSTLKIASAGPLLLGLMQDASAPLPVQMAALQTLSALEAPELAAAVAAAGQAAGEPLRLEARRLGARLSPADALAQAAVALKSGGIAEQRTAYQTLGTLADPGAEALLLAAMDRLAAGQVPPTLQLDLLQAAAARSSPALQARLSAYENSRASADLLAKWRECLEGGDAAAGHRVFAEKAEAGCIRCHKAKGEGGDVGPELAGVGERHDRAYLLTSILAPNAEIAPGFETVLLTLKDGQIAVGLLTKEDAATITLTPLDGTPKRIIAKETVSQRDKAPSAMPEGLSNVLTKAELRDVVEFLATLR